MFTLKFMRFREDGTSIETCVHVPHYEANQRWSGEWSIVAYPTLAASPCGVERHITRGHPEDQAELTYDCCFVENEKGKTICKYHIKD